MKGVEATFESSNRAAAQIINTVQHGTAIVIADLGHGF